MGFLLVEYNFLIGRKGALVYVGAILSKINPDTDICIIKGRGKLVNKAVDVALIAIKKLKKFKIQETKIYSKENITPSNRKLNLSCIEIKIGD